MNLANNPDLEGKTLFADNIAQFLLDINRKYAANKPPPPEKREDNSEAVDQLQTMPPPPPIIADAEAANKAIADAELQAKAKADAELQAKAIAIVPEVEQQPVEVPAELQEQANALDGTNAEVPGLKPAIVNQEDILNLLNVILGAFPPKVVLVPAPVVAPGLEQAEELAQGLAQAPAPVVAPGLEQAEVPEAPGLPEAPVPGLVPPAPEPLPPAQPNMTLLENRLKSALARVVFLEEQENKVGQDMHTVQKQNNALMRANAEVTRVNALLKAAQEKEANDRIADRAAAETQIARIAADAKLAIDNARKDAAAQAEMAVQGAQTEANAAREDLARAKTNIETATAQYKTLVDTDAKTKTEKVDLANKVQAAQANMQHAIANANIANDQLTKANKDIATARQDLNAARDAAAQTRTELANAQTAAARQATKAADDLRDVQAEARRADAAKVNALNERDAANKEVNRLTEIAKLDDVESAAGVRRAQEAEAKLRVANSQLATAALAVEAAKVTAKAEVAATVDKLKTDARDANLEKEEAINRLQTVLHDAEKMLADATETERNKVNKLNQEITNLKTNITSLEAKANAAQALAAAPTLAPTTAPDTKTIAETIQYYLSKFVPNFSPPDYTANKPVFNKASLPPDVQTELMKFDSIPYDYIGKFSTPFKTQQKDAKNKVQTTYLFWNRTDNKYFNILSTADL